MSAPCSRESAILGQMRQIIKYRIGDTCIRQDGTKVAVVVAVDTSLDLLLAAQLEAFKKAGFEVHAVCTEGPDFPLLRKRNFKMYPVRIKRSFGPFSDLVAVWRMYRYFRREKITVAHTHFPKAGLLGQLAAKLAGVPIIIHTLHGFYFHENMSPVLRWFHVTLERICAKCSTTILSQNPEDIETAVHLGICRPENIRLLGNGVNLSRFDPRRFDAEFKRKKRVDIGVSEDAIVVGIVGRLVREKGYLDLFQAMQRVMALNDRVWLLVIGPEEPEKADRISADAFRKYGIENRTRWLGQRNDIPELLACCDIYALPSWREGFPRSAIEAAAMGLPIVATNIRGCRQVVQDGVTGLLVPLRNITSLAAAIERLVNDVGLRGKMGRAGFEKARREFDENKVVEIVLDEYYRSLHRLSYKQV